MDKRDLVADFPPVTLPEALARALRDMMQINGQPSMRDYPHDRGLYEEHKRQWDNAKRVIEWFNREQSKDQ
jgi:hypothetical protein